MIEKPYPLSFDNEAVYCTTANRFWAKVNTANFDSCWNWTGSVKETGYGRFGIRPEVGRQFRAKILPASRVAWELTFGPIEDGLWVLHKCDNRRCVNPSHLFLGTAGDNNRDCHAKGRANWGEAVIAARAALTARTHCAKGHPFDEANTGYFSWRVGRLCLTCFRKSHRAAQLRTNEKQKLERRRKKQRPKRCKRDAREAANLLAPPETVEGANAVKDEAERLKI